MSTNINIVASSTLMSNNKQADIMSPQKRFEALQSQEGYTLFFSIGTDDVLYLTREVPGESTGWVKSDLSSGLSTFNGGIDIVVKDFMVAQNLTTNKIDMVLAIQGEDQDYVYTAIGLDNTDETWANPIQWELMPYDDEDHTISKIVVSDVYIAKAHSGENIAVDVLADPDSANDFIFRYFIDPTKTATGQIWNANDLSGNLNAGTIQSCLGRKNKEYVDGMYTMGTINNELELIYTPLYNYLTPNAPVTPTRLTIPQSPSSLATAPATGDYTSLFVAGNGFLYYFPYDQQQDLASGQVVLENELFNNVTTLYANATDETLTIWGLNQQGQVFYTSCEVGHELSVEGWSYPVPILTNVTEIATYLNNNTNGNVIFAHTDGGNLIQLTQDPTTTIWSQRNITLPSTDIDDVLTFNTYTTRVQLMQDNNIPVGGETVYLTSVSPVSVYVNNVFEILSPTLPLTVTTDDTGIITILQETRSTSAVCYNLQLEGSDEIVTVNPMLSVLDVMATVQSGDDLSNATVTNADGTTQPLVTADVSSDDLDATAQAIQQLVGISQEMPQDGSLQTDAIATKSVGQPTTALWGISYRSGKPVYYEGAAARTQFNRTTPTAEVAARGIGDAITLAAGDAWNWLVSVWDDVTDYFVEMVDGVYNFFITIGEQLYNILLDCMSNVINSIEFVFSTIGVLFEDLIKWAGFLFQWDDILRTHDVLKSVVNNYLQHVVDNIEVVKNNVDLLFNNLEDQLNQLTGVETVTNSLSEETTEAGPVPGQNDPQCNYGAYHLTNGLADSSTNSTVEAGIADGVTELLETLADAVKDEVTIFTDAIETYNEQVISQIETLSLGEIVSRSIGIIGDVLIESTQNLIDTALDVVEIIVNGVLDILNGVLEIPVLSWLYKELTGNDLTILDVACLVAAIPSTIMYKMMTNTVPFSDDDTTKRLINAASWIELQGVIADNESMQRMVGATDAKKSRTVGGLSLAETLDLLSRLTSAVCSVVFIATSTTKSVLMKAHLEKDPNVGEKVIKGASAVNCLFFFLTTLPNIVAGLTGGNNERWDKVYNDVVYGITSLQKIADIFTYKTWMKPWGEATRWIDTALGFADLVPNIAAVCYKQDVQTITSSITNVCWNSNRIVSPAARLGAGTTMTVMYGVKMGLILCFCAGQFAVCLEIAVQD